MTPLNSVFHSHLIVNNMTVVKLASKDIVDCLSQVRSDCSVLKEFRDPKKSD